MIVTMLYLSQFQKVKMKNNFPHYQEFFNFTKYLNQFININFDFLSIDSLLQKNLVDFIAEEEKRQKWIQLHARLRKMFWNQFQKRAAVLPLAKNRVRVLNLPISRNEFQRKNRRSRAMTILRTIAPQFHNGVDPQVQRRLWKDAMAVANTKGYENEIDMLENEGIHPNGKEKYASNDRWITLLKSEEPEGNINKYHYANSVQWPLNALPQLNPQV